ncbi:Type II secretion system (T2SS), protein F [uncultured archaeon]|nr:Type II secretion system (T2SS), protein F [uncultured archaeon]
MFVSADATVSSPAFFSILSIAAIAAGTTAAAALVAYLYLLLMADSRRKKVEEVLPGFLSLSAANVRAGMTIDQAMWYAAKPEFGILSAEVATVAKKSFGGVPFNTAIDYLAGRFDSKAIRRSVALIKQGLASGGQIADILERTAEDSRQMQLLQKEIAASLLMYELFIVFASVIGTPFLFAISGKLVSIMESLVARLPADAASSGGGMVASIALGGQPGVSSSDFMAFTIFSSVITAIFSSLIIGVIYRGSKREGVPYIPFIVGGTLVVYLLANALLSALLSGIYV